MINKVREQQLEIMEIEDRIMRLVNRSEVTSTTSNAIQYWLGQISAFAMQAGSLRAKVAELENSVAEQEGDKPHPTQMTYDDIVVMPEVTTTEKIEKLELLQSWMHVRATDQVAALAQIGRLQKFLIQSESQVAS